MRQAAVISPGRLSTSVFRAPHAVLGDDARPLGPYESARLTKEQPLTEGSMTKAALVEEGARVAEILPNRSDWQYRSARLSGAGQSGRTWIPRG